MSHGVKLAVSWLPVHISLTIGQGIIAHLHVLSLLLIVLSGFVYGLLIVLAYL